MGHQVYQLKQDFPGLVIVVNGGVTEAAQVTRHLSMVDGVMIGSAAFVTPPFFLCMYVTFDCWYLRFRLMTYLLPTLFHLPADPIAN